MRGEIFYLKKRIAGRGPRCAVFGAVLTASILFLSCRTQPLNTTATLDFSTTGFISDDTFQVIIREIPDARLQGLIDRRESSFFKAKENLQASVINRLADYYFSRNSQAPNIKANLDSKKNRLDFSMRMKNIIESGMIFDEFYNDDDSVILVYRIHKTGLKKEIESIQPPF